MQELQNMQNLSKQSTPGSVVPLAMFFIFSVASFIVMITYLEPAPYLPHYYERSSIQSAFKCDKGRKRSEDISYRYIDISIVLSKRRQ